MSQSLSKVLLHVVFSTKDRAPYLDTNVRPKMHAYLAGICKNCEAHAYRVGGIEDHVHLAVTLPRTLTIAKLVESLKVESSKWIKTQEGTYVGFSWQRGYGAFSVSYSDKGKLIKYIENQMEHHRLKSFQDEYRGFLRKYEIGFNEAYVWD